MLSIRALALLLGLPRFDPSRLAVAAVLLIVAIGLTIVGLLKLVAALSLYLRVYLSPALVDLATGAVILLLAAGFFLAARRLARPLPALEGGAGGAGDPMAQALRWVQQNPKQAAMVAAVLGFCAGALPEARKALSEILNPRR